MRAPPPPRAIVPALAAMAGVVVAHAVDYVVVFPQGDQRAAQLLGTGHAYWPFAVGAAAAAAAVAVMLAAARGARRAHGPRPWSRISVPAVRLGPVLGLQLAAFVVMEAGERATVGLPPSVLAHSPAFWFGLLLQIPVAWLATRVLATTEHVACRLAGSLRRRPARPRRVLLAPSVLLLPATAAPASPGRPRAPPLVLSV